MDVPIPALEPLPQFNLSLVVKAMLLLMYILSPQDFLSETLSLSLHSYFTFYTNNSHGIVIFPQISIVYLHMNHWNFYLSFPFMHILNETAYE